jgi:hypothetical protein
MTEAHQMDEDTRQLLLDKAQSCSDTKLFKNDGKVYKDKAAARAEPNQRLKQVFGIDNVFTSTDARLNRQFIGNTVSKMQTATKLNEFPTGNWQALKAATIASLTVYLQRNKETLNLSELVQFVTLKVSIGYLFDDATQYMEDHDSFNHIKYIGSRINELWVESKGDGPQLPRWENEQILHHALRAVTTETRSTDMPGTFPSSPKPGEPDPLEASLNPMNLLLPAYETMWRVVLRCLLEVHYRNKDRSDDWIQVLKTYLKSIDEPDNMEVNPF